MTPNDTNPADRSDKPLQVVFVVYPDISLLDLAGPLQAITWAKVPGTDRLGYCSDIVSLDGGRVPSDTLVSIDTQPMEAWRDRHIDTLIIVGGDGVYPVIEDEALVGVISRRDVIAALTSHWQW